MTSVAGDRTMGPETDLNKNQRSAQAETGLSMIEQGGECRRSFPSGQDVSYSSSVSGYGGAAAYDREEFLNTGDYLSGHYSQVEQSSEHHFGVEVKTENGFRMGGMMRQSDEGTFYTHNPMPQQSRQQVPHQPRGTPQSLQSETLPGSSALHDLLPGMSASMRQGESAPSVTIRQPQTGAAGFSARSEEVSTSSMRHPEQLF